MLFQRRRNFLMAPCSTGTPSAGAKLCLSGGQQVRNPTGFGGALHVRIATFLIPEHSTVKCPRAELRISFSSETSLGLAGRYVLTFYASRVHGVRFILGAQYAERGGLDFLDLTQTCWGLPVFSQAASYISTWRRQHSTQGHFGL